MPSVHRLSSRALSAGVLFAALAVSVALALLLTASSAAPARAASVGQLQQQISSGQGQIHGLSGAVGAAAGRVAKLGSAIAGLDRQLSTIQTTLNAKRIELLSLRSQLVTARSRLSVLEGQQAHAQTVLAQQLVSNYETAPPNIVTVVLESTGFQNLLDRLSFARKIQDQNVKVVRQVKASRRAVAAQAVRLGALEVRAQNLTAQVLSQRNALAKVQAGLINQRVAATQTRSAKAGQLAQVRSHVASLQAELAKLTVPVVPAAGSSGSGSGASSGSGSGATPPPAAAGSSGFVFPLPKSAASPPGTWSPDQGVDISAPGDTPEYAVCSGTIVLHGIGGFGPWAPVLHCDSPLDGYSYVYYGHAGPLYQQPVGTHVSAGQVMSSVGPGIVGISTGPHVEIGFCDSSGAPLGAQTAGSMLSLLQSSY
jgi:murein DD-endopeptidase MepM/ murein hydrolase activator NlpD